MAIVKADDRNFDEVVAKATTPIVLDFWATWCAPCISLTKTLEGLSVELQGKVTIVSINVEESTEVSMKFGARSLPFLVFLKNGETVHQIFGNASKEKLKKSMSEYLGV